MDAVGGRRAFYGRNPSAPLHAARDRDWINLRVARDPPKDRETGVPERDSGATQRAAERWHFIGSRKSWIIRIFKQKPRQAPFPQSTLRTISTYVSTGR